jgi:hypothetical protein
MERMKGRKITEEELKALGWEFRTLFTDTLFIFAKGEKRVCWNKSTGLIEREYTYKP